MRSKTSFWKRSLAALLSLVMVLGMIPAFGFAPLAYAEENADATDAADETGDGNVEKGPDIDGNYITLPITIRDFAADGMLFEYNEVNVKGTNRFTVASDNEGHAFYYNPTEWGIGGSLGFQVYDFHGSSTTGSWNSYPVIDENTAVYWHCVILDYYGDVLEVIPSGEVKTSYNTIATTDYDGDGYTKGMYDAWYSVWAWAGDGAANNNDEAYNLLSQITDDHKDLYRVGLDLTNYNLYVGNRIRINGDFGTTPGIRYFDSDDLTLSDDATGRYWHCVICDSDGYVVKVLPKDTIKREAYAAAMQDGYFSVWAWGGDGSDQYQTNEIAYNEIACITEGKEACYQITFFGSAEGNSLDSDVLYVDEIKTFHQADTQAFGLLATDTNDYLNILADAAVKYDAEAENDDYLKEFSSLIYGTQLFRNGSWNSTTVSADAISYLFDTSNEGETRGEPYASQIIHGANVRTNMVDMELDAEGKPIYTKETVEFLAEFMEQIMAVPWQNADGSYNTYHVEGVKLFKWNDQFKSFDYVPTNNGAADESATHDLADVLRHQVKNSTADDKLGTYGASNQKFAAGGLRHYSDVETWFDAAYFLLNNFWRDSFVDLRGTVGQDGYGMPIDRYESLHLIETTNEDGEVCYVFNAKYDDTVYDWNEGDIYNTQLVNGAIVQQWSDSANDGEGGYVDTYAYGNPLPVSRFDPLGMSGAKVNQGYGMSSGTYGNMTGHHPDRHEFYDETNYNLSLEGHAQFVYHYDANQYFTFTGDDDVYLYVNGIRVLDIGGAHSISKVSVDLNKVAEICGLHDGGTYAFDFFFLERHGTAANFGIETNIQIADASMNTYKTGYQNRASTGYNGWVDPAVPVGYSFELQNDGEASIYNLTFDDSDIGVYFGWDRIQLYPEGFPEDGKIYSLADMYMYIFNADGTVKDRYLPGTLDEGTITGALAAGLAQGERIGIYGFKYDITKGAERGLKTWAEDGSFTNTVYTSATTDPDETVAKLHGQADWKVRKMSMPFTPFHVYDWVAKDVSKNPDTVCDWYSPAEATVNVTQRELLQYFVDEKVITAAEADALIATGKVTTVLCTASGQEDAYNQNPNAKLENDGSITYTSTKPGMDTIFYKLKYTGLGDNNVYDEYVFNYDVYTYGVVNNVYVLDYGLSVELNGESFGLMSNDTLWLAQNKYAPTAAVTGIQDATSNYGDFTWDDPSLKYTPDEIINNIDSVRANIELRETLPAGVTLTEDNLKFYGLDMYETVTTAPASVVYYEENFPGITYVNSGENQWIHYETVDEEGNSVAGTEQSADQDMNYGFDDNYAEDKIGWDEEGASQIIFKLDNSDPNVYHQQAVAALNEYLGLADEDSNGTVNKLIVKEKADVMWFDFVGTGFEIVSRTTNEQYAVLKVSVHLIDEDGNIITNQKDADGNVPRTDLPATNAAGRVAVIPVITESKGGTLYQVPIISLTGMPKARYRVTVTAAGNADGTRILYIDGLRIYGPLSDDEALEYYNPEEYKAAIYEIKDLIANYQAIFADLSDTDDEPLMGTGTTLIEDTGDTGYVLTNVNAEGEDVTLSDYLSVGPNNEIYLDGNNGSNMIALFLTPDEDVPVAERTIQIGAHRKADSADGYDDDVGMFYGTSVDALTVDDITDQPYYHLITSGTEQYYDIDVQYLEMRDDGRYLLMIVAGESTGEGFIESLALTNLKVKGYTISFNLAQLTADDENGTLNENPLVSGPYTVLKARRAAMQEEEEVETVRVNENLEITSAALRANSVASGKTATLSVKASSEATTIVVTDAAGNVVEYTRCTPKATSSGVTFTFLWKVTGSRGDVQTYTIRAYDANGLASVNTETVSITIK